MSVEHPQPLSREGIIGRVKNFVHKVASSGTDSSSILASRLSRRTLLKAAAGVIGGIAANGFDNTSQVNASHQLPNDGIAADSLSAETLQGPEFTWDRTSVTPEWLRTNPQLVMSIHNTKNENGEVTQQHVLMNDGRIVESHYDGQTKQMSEYALVLEKKPAMERPTQLYVFSDGTMVVGGEKVARSGLTALELWDPIKKEWKNIEIPRGIGVVKNLIPIPGTNKLLINLLHPEEPTIKMHLATVDLENKDMTVQATNLNGKALTALSLISVDANKKEVVMLAGGSNYAQEGLSVFTINYETGDVKTETLFPELGRLNGVDNFKNEATGDQIAIVTNAADGFIAYVNMTTKKIEQKINVEPLFDNRGISDHMSGTCYIRSVKYFKHNNKNYIVLGASYSSTLDGSERVAFGMYEYGTDPYRTLVFNAPEAGSPIRFSNIQWQENMEIITTPNKEVVVDAKVDRLGKMIWDFTKNAVVRTVRGMNNTQMSRPQSTRPPFSPNSVFLPTMAK